ncbi:WXG100 family type VII secretion target [Actinacidiphila sp. bgisy167]|uniref:WXG100 family type VII secretion target n=1 Tax=Actinacidiphila sp. bgisy167 TaxID=3413797 RepID=UPI003D706EE5
MTNIEGAVIRVGRDLEGSGAYLNSRAAEIMGELSRLKQNLQTLIDAWQAQSATEYQARMYEWDQAATGLFGSEAEGGVLGEIAAAMKVNWDNYHGTEEANLKTFMA